MLRLYNYHTLHQSFLSLEVFCHGLNHLDEFHGLPYGETAPSLANTGTHHKPPPKQRSPKNTNNMGVVAAIQDT
jgi:hypothetical protein